MRRRTAVALALAGTLAAASALAQQDGAGREKCYGVARAGQNDGIGPDASPGSATADYQGDAWTWVAAGTCATIPLPPQPDGTPRRGAIEPLRRDLP